MPFLDSSQRIVKVWVAYVRASIMREMEFRGNFAIGLIRQGLWLAAFIFLIEIIFSNTTSLAGWGRYEVFTILALSRIIEGFIGIVFISNIIGISEKVQTGTFDYILTKPLPLQFATFFNRINLGNFGNFIAGVILLIYAARHLPPASWQAYVLGFLLAAVGIVIYYSLLVIVASLVFYIDRMRSLWAFNALFSEPLTVPFSVFPAPPRIVLTYLLPLAFVVFVPAQALTGRLTWWQLPVAVGLAAVFLLLANLAWRAGLRRYSSASS